VLVAAWPAHAQQQDLDLPISVDADSVDYDGKTSMLMYTGLKLSQGRISVQADEARASSLDFEDSVWHFRGNVVIDGPQGHVECETADVRFQGHELRSARVTGSPATFELRRPDSESPTRAQAQSLVYDFAENVVEFSGDAVITEGGNRISSDYLVYNITEQRIKAQSSGDGKVRIKYTPDPGARQDEQADDAGGSGEPENEAAGQ
jgi:lipopolysaccharide export system protein LptA